MLEKICRRFLPGLEKLTISPYGSGHINDTFKIETPSVNYILQRINHRVFTDINGLTGNLTKVTKHIEEHIYPANPAIQVLRSIPAKDGQSYLVDEDENYWRMFNFIEESISYDRVESVQIAAEGGRAYGQFMHLLNDFPVEELAETIPRFHDIEYRLDNFNVSLRDNPADRADGVQREIDFAWNRSEEMRAIHRLGETGQIPHRVTHNDTKVNNVLFDSCGRAICVIDLDTVMPGFVHFDFGDAIRTFTNTADEDEMDLSKVTMNITYFEAFTEGFLSEVAGVLNSAERETLAFSAKFMTYIMGLRFLTDYLDGDTYYKTAYSDHNIVRARNQFRLLESMERRFQEMEAIVSRSG